MPIRVAVIEDHPLMLQAVVQDLEADDEICVVGTATHGAELQRLVRETSPDVLILDLGFATGEFEPITAVKALRRVFPQVHILVLTAYENAVWMRELFAAGVRGYVLKHDDLSLHLPEGVRRVYRGERFYSPAVVERLAACGDVALSAQEATILRLMAQGLSNSGIGRELGLAESTVRNYCCAIYAKLGIPADDAVNARVVAVTKAKELGLIQ